MATDGDKIEYKDLIGPDDSILELLIQLEQLNKSYGVMINAVRAGAKEIVYAMRQVSGATSEGKAKIDEATAAADRLERAEKELKFALSDVGKEVAWVKAQTADVNRVTVEQERQIKALTGSYDKINLELKDHIKLWKSLSAAERANSEMGGEILSSIISLKKELAEINKQLNPTVAKLTELQKAEERLAFLQSEEGKRLMELKKQIRELQSERNNEKVSLTDLDKAYQRLSDAWSEENSKIQELNLRTAEANRLKKLEAQLSMAATGSYEQLSAQYELNKIKLNKMSAETRNATAEGKELEEQTLLIYKQMIHLQEATGNHKLSVGNYVKVWDGLGNSINQVVREIPSLTLGFNTFFLAISNNIPIVIDEIQRLKEKNQMLRAEGRPTQNIIKTIVSSIFSWQTALILGITFLSMHGEEVIEWIKNLGKGPGIILTIKERLKNLNEELKTTNASYGENVTSIKKLQLEWKNLSSKEEQLQWIRDNKSEFDKLDISINGVTDAENVFVNNTAAVIEALKLRAKASAATKLASEQYEEALIKKNEAETEAAQGPSAWDKFLSYGSGLEGPGASGYRAGTGEVVSAEKFKQDRIDDLKAEAKAAEANGDAYFDMAAGYEAAAKAILKKANIEEKHKNDKSRTREPRDLTDTINRNSIAIQRKYEESITKLQRDEYVQRRKSVVDATLDANRQLEEKYRKNEEYINNIDGKYKQLDESQRQQIMNQQQWIQKTIANNLEQLNFEIEQIEKERQINSIKILRETVEWELETIIDSIDEEQKIKLQQLEHEEELVKKTNAALTEGGRSEVEITAEYAKKRLDIIAKYGEITYELRQQDIENQLKHVKKGSQEELRLLLEQNEMARRLALLQNSAKPASQQQSAASINSLFDLNASRISGSFTISGLEEAQELAFAEFNIVKRSEYQITKFKLNQEKERWQKQIELAEAGGLDWSQAQIDAAKATVKGIERQLKEETNFMSLVGDKGFGGAILTKLGFNDDQIKALDEASNIMLENIQAVFEAETELAEMELETAKQRVEAAQNAYDAEIEARNNGYANNVATAKKELQLEKKNQLEKEKILESAKKRQERIDSALQASSLVTASANIWSSLSSIPIVGPALAIAMIATMWGSFAAAKIKANQVTRASSQEYGEGGLEFLDGGSHASGDDIDLKTKNSKGKNMRAEGGEALAIINRRSTRRYRKQLPNIIQSLNKGTFEDKYLKAFEHGETLQAHFRTEHINFDLSKLEKDVTEIKKQNSLKYITLSDGTTLMIKGNITRHIK